MKRNNKLSRVLIFTYSTPEELDIKKLSSLNDKYISELYNNNEEKGTLFKNLLRLITDKKLDTKVIFLETGIGKLNSYTKLNSIFRDMYENYNCENIMLSVVNLGTAGSSLEKIGEVINCGRFIDVDIASFEIGDYINNYDWFNNTYKFVPDSNPNNADLNALYMYSCNSRDKFVMDMDDSFQKRDGWTAVCDTEGFAQAKCCEDWSKIFDREIKFSSIKFITHNFDLKAIETRKELLPKACEILTEKASKFLYNFYYAKN